MLFGLLEVALPCISEAKRGIIRRAVWYVAHVHTTPTTQTRITLMRCTKV